MKQLIESGDPDYDKFHFMWNITNWCNYDCYYCYAKEIMVDSWQKDESISKYKLVLKRLEHFDSPFEVDLLGGEPTLHPHLNEILTKLTSIKNCKKAEIFTNLSRPLSYFKKLEKEIKSPIAISASFHAEYYDPKFLEKILLLKNMEKLKVRVTMVIIDKEEYWELSKKVLDKLIENDIGYSLHLLHETGFWKPNYSEEMMNHFKPYETKNQHSLYYIDYKYSDGTKEKITTLDVISKDLNRFNKFKCDSRFFDIRFDGEIINTCTRKKINSIILKKEFMNNIVTCPRHYCACESMLNCHKVKNEG